MNKNVQICIVNKIHNDITTALTTQDRQSK